MEQQRQQQQQEERPSVKVERLLSALTLQEKCNLLSGKNMWETSDIPRLGIKSLKTTDGPAGVRGARWTDGTHTTYIPCGISLAATFDPPLVQQLGQVLGKEAISKHAHVLLAPTMNISRSPLGGRNFENFGEDPFLTGVMATAYIKGVQGAGNVGACMKHFVGNDAETRRFNMDEKIDERTLREIYMRPFEMVLESGLDPWMVMTAYPKINGEHADTSRFLVHDVLRKEWGYDGVVISDWGGLNSTVGSIRATTDLEMPGPPLRYGKALEAAVKFGLVSEAEDVTPSVRRVLALLDRAELLACPGPRSSKPPLSACGENKVLADSRIEDGEQESDTLEVRQAARAAATGGIVLLQNRDSCLPLAASDVKKIAIIGPNAKTPTTGGTGSAIVNPYYITNPHDSIVDKAKALNPAVEVTSERGIFTHLQPPLIGSALTADDGDGARTGLRVDFYRGHNFEGDIIATTFWNDSIVYSMSDGDIPASLQGQPCCYRASGVLRPPKTGTYNFSLSNTGKTKLYLDDELFIDNWDWTEISGNFMNCGSAEVFASKHLEEKKLYHVRIDNVIVPPPTPPHDNTLFHKISGVRVGMLLQVDEDELFKAAVDSARDANVAIVIVGHNNDTEREGSDRTSMSLPGRTDELVAAVCAANSRTVVVTQSACAVAMPWASAPAAIVHAWYQGQENGNALADVIFGTANPSGKLPVTFPRRIEDHGSHRWFPGDAERDQAVYGEGVLVGYRWFDDQNIEPLWPFGFGLSYTTFSVENIAVSGRLLSQRGRAQQQQIKVRASVTNTGDVAGSEVVQVYVSSSEAISDSKQARVPKALAGFAKVHVAPKMAEAVEIPISSSSFQWFDLHSRSWRLDKGSYTCYVGTSSRHIAGVVEIVVE